MKNENPISEVYFGDCMEYMKSLPDNFADLAVCDPPYGGGQHFNFRYGTGDQVYDSRKPDPLYFQELERVSKNQIIWGGNYFTDCLRVSRCWINWYKANPCPGFSDFELAWTSFDKVSRQVNLPSYGFRHADKKNEATTIHPTQKPVALYEWILRNYAKPGDKILDTHLGSQSSRIAAYKLGFDFWGCEINDDYIREGNARFEKEIAMPLFDAQKPTIQPQLTLI